MTRLYRVARLFGAMIVGGLIIAAVGLVAMSNKGLNPVPGEAAAGDKPSRNSLSITPSQLFSGPLLKLKPHFRFITDGACTVNIPVSPRERSVEFTVEVWIDGRKITTDTGSLAFSPMESEATASITLAPADVGLGENAVEITAAVNDSDSLTTSRQTVRLKGLEKGHGSWFFPLPQKLTLGEEIPVWGFGTPGPGARERDPIGADDVRAAILKHSTCVLLKVRLLSAEE